ncbi:MAG: ABC-2 family transporter protein [Fimbriimonadales bacterium]|nr:ABC-2 family transporter protein [Fimbriimonadales bacterium]
MNRLRFHWNLYKAFLRTSLVREMEFRANFWAKVFYNLLWLGFFLATLKIIYRHTDAIAGWSEAEALVLAATLYFIDALISTLFYFGLSELPTMVRQGTLDFVLFKPVDSQFWISLRRINLDQLGSLGVAVLLGIYALLQLGYMPPLANCALYLGMVLTGVLIFYSFHFMMMTLSIWLVRVENLWVLSDVFAQIGRFPTDVFETMLRRLFTYVLPIAFLATIPAKALLGKASAGFLWFAVAWALVFFVTGRLFWRFALRSYTSASS